MGGRVRGRGVRAGACVGMGGRPVRAYTVRRSEFFTKTFGSLRSLATSSYLFYTIFIMLWRCLKISFLLIAVAYIACVGDLCRRMIFGLRYGWAPAWHRFRRDFIALNASWVAVGRWIIHKTTSLMSRLR